jgi:TetR/AcrR family transcriptional repressor of nem operon
MQRYTEGFLAALAAIDASDADARQKLERYVAIYAGVLASERMCLCGMLAAEYATLPKPIRAEVTRFFNANEAWLASVLDAGRNSGSLAFAGPAAESAHVLIAALEGAMMLARSYGDTVRFHRAAQHLLTAFI